MFGLISRRRHTAELAAARAVSDRLRRERDTARSAQQTAEFNREQILRQLAEATTANRRLHGRNLELGRRVSALAESDPEYAGQLERRVDRLKKVTARLYAGARAEKARADHLQRRLDDAVGLGSRYPLDSASWQPGHVVPKPDKEVAGS